MKKMKKSTKNKYESLLKKAIHGQVDLNNLDSYSLQDFNRATNSNIKSETYYRKAIIPLLKRFKNDNEMFEQFVSQLAEKEGITNNQDKVNYIQDSRKNINSSFINLDYVKLEYHDQHFTFLPHIPRPYNNKSKDVFINQIGQINFNKIKQMKNNNIQSTILAMKIDINLLRNQLQEYLENEFIHKNLGFTVYFQWYDKKLDKIGYSDISHQIGISQTFNTWKERTNEKIAEFEKILNNVGRSLFIRIYESRLDVMFYTL